MKQWPSVKVKKHFEKIFQTGFKEYWDIMTGFDIISFDEFMQTKRGYIEDDKTSLSDFVKQRYGSEAEALIRLLIAM